MIGFRADFERIAEQADRADVNPATVEEISEMATTSDVQSLCKQAQRAVRHREYDQAIDLFLQAIELDVDCADAHEGLAAAYFLTNNYESAVECFSKVTLLRPLEGSAQINLGAVYNRMGEYQKAVDILRKGLAKERKSAEGYYNLGIAYRQQNQSSMAMSAYREAIRLNPEMAEAHQNLANVYLDMANTGQAIQHYEQALELRPNFERAKRGLQRAQQAKTKSQQEMSPFGRLVDEASYASASASTVKTDLSYQERFDDRQKLQTLSEEILPRAREFLQQLKDELQFALLDLSRAVVERTRAGATVISDHQKFQSAVEQYEELRKQLKEKLVELKNHEEQFVIKDS